MKKPLFLIEHLHDKDGACRNEVHGPTCPRTQWAVADLERREASSRTTSGPAQVSTDAYRAGWQMIFGGSTPVGSA